MRRCRSLWALLALCVVVGLPISHAWAVSYIPSMPQLISLLPVTSAGTLLTGVTFVPPGFPTGGTLQAGDLLVASSDQVTNTLKLLRVPRAGEATVFYPGAPTASPIPSTLTTALVVSKSGLVLFGSPANNQIYIIDNNGQLLGSFSDPLIQNPHGFAVAEGPTTAQLFVSNERAGTIVRLDFAVTPQGWRQVNSFLIGEAFQFPQGLVYTADNDHLYIAEAGTHLIRSLNHATRTTINQGVGAVVTPQPIGVDAGFGLAATPNRHLLVTTPFAGKVTEITRTGTVIRTNTIDRRQGRITVTGIATNFSAQTTPSELVILNNDNRTLLFWILP